MHRPSNSHPPRMAKLDYHYGPAPTSAGGRGPDRRGVVAVVGAAALAGAVLAYSGPSWPLVAQQFVIDGTVLVGWLLGAAALGMLLLAPLRRGEIWTGDDAVLRFVTATAFGLGVLSLLTLGLGLVGALNRGVAVGIVICAIGAGAILLWRRHGKQLAGDIGLPIRTWLGAPAGWHWLWLLLLPPLAVAVVGAYVPPGFLWTPDEPHGYDVVEYHLQVPREWYEAGRIVPLRHNAFSYFPFGVEMHYLFAMHLRGGPWKGMYLAQLMHVTHVALTVLAVYGLARSLSGKRSVAVAAALAAASAPWLTLLAPVAYNEGGVLLYGTLAAGWAVRAIGATPRAALARLAVAGVMAGFACGVKLTAVPMLLLAVPVALVIAWPRGLRYAVPYVVLGSIVFAPWAVRNLVWAGNPVFPEAARVLGPAHFAPVQAERWERAHSPRPDQKSVGARLGAAWREIMADWRFGYVLSVAGVFAAAVGFRDRRVRVLAALVLVNLLFWLAFTHLQGRFFVLAVPLVALMVGLAPWGRAAPCVVAILAASAVGSWGMVHQQFAARLFGASPIAGVLAVEDFSPLQSPAVSAVPPDATLVLIGEARAFWYQRPMKNLRYRTVFDVPPGTDVIESWRGGTAHAPGEWELINPSELQRFADTYWGIPPMPAELKAHTDSFVVPPQTAADDRERR